MRKKNKRAALLLAAVGILLMIAGSVTLPESPTSNIIHPTTPAELRKVVVQLAFQKGSGSGIILRSSAQGTDILTNAHVCLLADKGGAVFLGEHQVYPIKAIKPSQLSDLCLVHLSENLGVGVEISGSFNHTDEPVLIGGHPLNLPLVTQRGTASEVFDIGEPGNPFMVFVTSVLVQPGHSGSGVFGADGKLIGLIFAHRMPSNVKVGVIGFGVAVSTAPLSFFVFRESAMLPWRVVPSVPRSQ